MFKTEGIVLRTRNLNESDKVVTLYTKSHGKVVAAARGARRIRNRLLGPTQVFTYGKFLIFEGKSLDTLSQGEISNSFQDLRDDLEKMAAAMYICELVDVFNEPGEANPTIFTLIYSTLIMLSKDQGDFALRAFELKLAQSLGYEPQLNQCISCSNPMKDKIYFSREGGVVCGECRGMIGPTRFLSRGTWELAKRILEWEAAKIGILHPSAISLEELELCMRDYLDYRLDKPLRSLDFLHTLKQFPKSGGDG